MVIRFQTDANIAGTEKLAVSAIQPEIPRTHGANFHGSDISDTAKDCLAPMSVFLVKGWTRAVCAITCLLHAWESPDTVLKARCSSSSSSSSSWLQLHETST